VLLVVPAGFVAFPNNVFEPDVFPPNIDVPLLALVPNTELPSFSFDEKIELSVFCAVVPNIPADDFEVSNCFGKSDALSVVFATVLDIASNGEVFGFSVPPSAGSVAVCDGFADFPSVTLARLFKTLVPLASGIIGLVVIGVTVTDEGSVGNATEEAAEKLNAGRVLDVGRPEPPNIDVGLDFSLSIPCKLVASDEVLDTVPKILLDVGAMDLELEGKNVKGIESAVLVFDSADFVDEAITLAG